MKKHFIRSALAFIFVFSVFFGDSLDSKDLSVNLLKTISLNDTKIKEEIINIHEGVIYSNDLENSIGNGTCQEYKSYFNCQFFIANLAESKNRYEVYLISEETKKEAPIGNLKQNKEGIYFLETSVDKLYFGKEIIIKEGTKIVGKGEVL